jgi:hypothetical protein
MVSVMKPIILLDIIGVLNRKLQLDDSSGVKNAQRSDLKVALIWQLATKGRLAWCRHPLRILWTAWKRRWSLR